MNRRFSCAATDEGIVHLYLVFRLVSRDSFSSGLHTVPPEVQCARRKSSRKATMKPQTRPAASPKQQLDSFLAKYDPAIATFARRVLAKLRKRLPGAVEMVYDNYNALVIGFGPNDRPSLAIFSVVLFPRWVILYFLQGASLPDLQRRLQGGGKVGRHIRLEGLSTLDDPYVQDLMNLALHRAKAPLDPKNRRQLIIKSISAKQRPRRPVSGQ